jgi:hypothetical protein
MPSPRDGVTFAIRGGEISDRYFRRIQLWGIRERTRGEPLHCGGAGDAILMRTGMDRGQDPDQKFRARAPWLTETHIAAIFLLISVLMFHSYALLSPNASIQWDAVDVHYSSQRYLADEVRSGRLPHWTPYLFSGFPFLADVQVGAWYPLNWPFLALGILPKFIQAELFMHSLLACYGAFLLALLWFPAPASAVVALTFGLSGFFTGHSSHVGMYQTAAWLPWLLLGVKRSADGDGRAPFLTALGAGCVILAGHFQTSLYCFSAMAIFGCALVPQVAMPARFRVLRCMAMVAVGAVALSSIMWLPGLELVLHSVRTRVRAAELANGFLNPESLLTLINPNFYGVLSSPKPDILEGLYTGPKDITAYYFYAGALLIPLVILGLFRPGTRLLGLGLIIPTAWYAAGPAGGLFSLIASLPGFASIRGPINAWFVCALGLSLLAGAGASWLQERSTRRRRRAVWILLVVLAVDLHFQNSRRNPLAYQRGSFGSTYGAKLNSYAALLRGKTPLGTRIEGPEYESRIGSLNNPLDLRKETTYGYNPLALLGYAQYVEVMRDNPALRDGLAAQWRFNRATWSLDRIETALPRVYVPKVIRMAATIHDSYAALRTLRPAEETVISGPEQNLTHDPHASAEITRYGIDSYSVSYHAASSTVLRIAVPFFPGWTASIGNHNVEIRRADHAWMAVLVPGGTGIVNLQYRSRYFIAGALISTLAVMVLLVLSIRKSKQAAQRG